MTRTTPFVPPRKAGDDVVVAQDAVPPHMLPHQTGPNVLTHQTRDDVVVAQDAVPLEVLDVGLVLALVNILPVGSQPARDHQN